jgi:hypothetical protein
MAVDMVCAAQHVAGAVQLCCAGDSLQHMTARRLPGVLCSGCACGLLVVPGVVSVVVVVSKEATSGVGQCSTWHIGVIEDCVRIWILLYNIKE